MKQLLTSKLATSILAFVFIFFTGWAAAEILVNMKTHNPVYNHVILGIFSLILGIRELYILSKK